MIISQYEGKSHMPIYPSPRIMGISMTPGSFCDLGFESQTQNMPVLLKKSKARRDLPGLI